MDFKRYKFLKNNIFLLDKETNTFIKRPLDTNLKYINPLVLAYIGDAYFHLYIRTYLLDYEYNNIKILNDISMLFVSATYQARATKKIIEHLSEDEISIYKRAKNTKSHAPRVATVNDYHVSTGIEAVIGYLHLENKVNRLNELCNLIFKTMLEFYYDDNIKKRE